MKRPTPPHSAQPPGGADSNRAVTMHHYCEPAAPEGQIPSIFHLLQLATFLHKPFTTPRIPADSGIIF